MIPGWCTTIEKLSYWKRQTFHFVTAIICVLKRLCFWQAHKITTTVFLSVSLSLSLTLPWVDPSSLYQKIIFYCRCSCIHAIPFCLCAIFVPERDTLLMRLILNESPKNLCYARIHPHRPFFTYLILFRRQTEKDYFMVFDTIVIIPCP